LYSKAQGREPAADRRLLHPVTGTTKRLSLYPVTLFEIDGTRVKIGLIPRPRDGSPVLDIRLASTRAD